MRGSQDEHPSPPDDARRRSDTYFKWAALLLHLGTLRAPVVKASPSALARQDSLQGSGVAVLVDVTMPGLAGRISHGTGPGDLDQIMESWHVWEQLWCSDNSKAIYRPVDGRMVLWYEELAPLPGQTLDRPCHGLWVGGGLARGTWPVCQGVVRTVALVLRPGVIRRLLGVPSADMVGLGRSVPDLLGPTGFHLLDDLAKAPDAGTCLGLLFAHLRSVALPIDPDSARSDELVRGLTHGGPVAIADLATDSGLSQRSLQRLFNEQVGLAPKTMAGIARVRTVLERVHGPDRCDRSALAYDAGFADQAHLVREFTAAVGITPERYLQIFRRCGLEIGGHVYLQIREETTPRRRRPSSIGLTRVTSS